MGGRGRWLGFGRGIVVGWRTRVGRCESHLEGVGKLAVGEGCAGTLDGDVPPLLSPTSVLQLQGSALQGVVYSALTF